MWLTNLSNSNPVVSQYVLERCLDFRNGFAWKNTAVHLGACRLRKGILGMAALQHGCHAGGSKLGIVYRIFGEAHDGEGGGIRSLRKNRFNIGGKLRSFPLGGSTEIGFGRVIESQRKAKFRQ